ncbi:MAG TPA: acyl carrier protein [Elusimicrobiota bacterium]|nr:acyl carrier protein [Elusimicrobiota bacterium]
MNPQELHDRLQEIFRQVFDSETLMIRDETTAAEIEGWDSLAQINLVVGAEERFGVRFQTAEIRSLKNVGEFKRLIAGKLAAS